MNSDFVIRPGGAQDTKACARIVEEWVWGARWFPNVRSTGFATPMIGQRIAGGQVTVADHWGRVAGFMALDGDYLHCIYVAYVHRSNGVGHLLLERARELSPGGLYLWTFERNMDAIRFYEREGFMLTDRTDGRDNEVGLPDMRFDWTPRGGMS